LVTRTINEQVRPLLTIQHYKGCSNIDSTGNYEWFFTMLREQALRPCFPGSLNYGMFAFLKIKLLPIEIAHRGSPRGSLNKFAWNERARVNTDRDFPSVRYDDVSLCAHRSIKADLPSRSVAPIRPVTPGTWEGTSLKIAVETREIVWCAITMQKRSPMREIFTNRDVISRNRIFVNQKFFFLMGFSRREKNISRNDFFFIRAIRYSNIDLAPSAVGLLL